MYEQLQTLTISRRLFAALTVSLLFAATVSGQTLPLDAKGSTLTFVCGAFLHDFRGEAKDLTGNADLDATAVPPIQKATLHFKTATITTFQQTRDQKMRDWLNVTIHPDAMFQLESVKMLGGDYKTTDASRPAKFAVSGNFTLNGVKQRLACTAQGWRDKDRVIVAGDITVDTSKHGLLQIREAVVISVDADVKVSFRFAFVLPPDYAAK